MQEAPYSVNFVMFDPDGLRMQFTVRRDTEDDHVQAVTSYVEKLKNDGWRVSEKPRMPESWADVASVPAAHGEFVNGKSTEHRKPGTVEEKQLNTLHALGNALYGSQKVWDEKRPGLVKHFSKDRTESSKLLWVAEATQMIGKLEERVREEYAKLSEGWPNPFELANIDVKYGVELAQAMQELRAMLAKAPVKEEVGF